MTSRDVLSRELLFVTGKGGVGKTTIAAALGTVASGEGRRVLVCEGEPRGGLSSAYECGPTGYEPREIAPNLFAMSMRPDAALREYLRLNFHLPSSLVRFGPLAPLFELATTALPGVREVLAVGKLCYEVRERHYDIVIVDAQASGSVLGYLAAPSGVNDLVRSGGVRTETNWMLEILADPKRTGVVAVTTPEEMPVNECLELARALEEKTEATLCAVVANRVQPELFSRSDEDTFDAISSDAGRRSLQEITHDEHVGEVLDVAQLALELRRGSVVHLERLRSRLRGDVPILLVPELFARTEGPRAIHQVAVSLTEELSD